MTRYHGLARLETEVKNLRSGAPLCEERQDDTVFEHIIQSHTILFLPPSSLAAHLYYLIQERLAKTSSTHPLHNVSSCSPLYAGSNTPWVGLGSGARTLAALKSEQQQKKKKRA